LVSSSDAHSPAKIAREATKFEGEMSYGGIVGALRNGSLTKLSAKSLVSEPTKLIGTIEFFPEEGKYHFDGHSAHQIRLSPAETKSKGGVCPTCGRPVTVGVLSRVEALADRAENFRPKAAPAFWPLVPLEEIIAEAVGVRVGTKKVSAVYESLLQVFGNELTVLLDAPIEKIESAARPPLAEAIRRVRAGKLLIEPGYDGEYGTVHIFEPKDRRQLEPVQQASLF
ncbi:DNA helicase UvrD, partial [Candidatus Saccharibacteria bacterium]|nr:DNA helicase UvrD [Candidatus Saccharibacteria bacterium]